MCGISGHLARRGTARSDLVRTMTEALKHRGPDGMNFYDTAEVSLGFNRLAIIDPGGSWQPFINHDSTIVLIVNGEIYNYRELRKDLLSKGHVFRSKGDCEVILHLYEEHGTLFLDRLRGMFALALWDERMGRLLLARDRLGEKPLYLRESPDGLLFASEAKALIAAGVDVELEPRSVNAYFHLEYVTEPDSILRGVQKIPAGHLITVNTKDWAIHDRPYWLLNAAEARADRPDHVIADLLRELSPLVAHADQPIGVALSGGIDSSIVAALAARDADIRPKAFSVGYTGHRGIDERELARSFANELDMEFHEIELGPASVVRLFPQVVAAWDDPIADMAGICYFAVMRSAREAGVRVMLQGQGADELFWGYPWVREAMRRADRGSAPIFYELDPDFREARDDGPRYYGEAMRGLTPPLFPPTPPDQLIMSTYLRENGIAQGDRLSMANSVELRLPFVDHHLVDAVIGLRKAAPDHHEPPKHRLREAVRFLLPTAIIDRPKRSFSPPIKQWYEILFASYGELLLEGELVRRGIISPAAARELTKAHFPPGGGSPFAFKALALEMWCRHNLLRRGARPC